MNKQNNASFFLTSLVVDSALETAKTLMELVNKCEEEGKDTVTVQELKALLANGVKEALKEDSITSQIMAEEI